MEISSIHEAARVEDVSMVKYFLDLGISVDSLDDSKCTPLHIAAWEGHVRLAEFLINNNCDLEAKSITGKTALMFAAELGHKDVLVLLRQSGADLNSMDDDNFTALHFAAAHDKLEAVRFLINDGADLDARTIDGETPLMVSARDGCKDTVDFLLQSGAGVDCKDSENQTALHYATMEGHLEIIKSLISMGACLNAKSYDGVTPLMLAVRHGNLKVVDLLIQYGANLFACVVAEINCRFFYKSTVLEMIMLLINDGAHVKKSEFKTMCNSPFLKDSILKNKEFSTKAVINKFNNFYLPTFYRLYAAIKKMPPSENLKKYICENVAKDIEKSVNDEIKTKTFCNILELRPTNLKLLAILCLVDNYVTPKRHALPNYYKNCTTKNIVGSESH